LKDTPKDKEFDIRHEIIKLFEEVMTHYLLGRDIAQETLTINVVKKDGSIVAEKLHLFDALTQCFETGFAASSHKFVFGDYPATKVLQASQSNYKLVYQYYDKIIAE